MTRQKISVITLSLLSSIVLTQFSYAPTSASDLSKLYDLYNLLRSKNFSAAGFYCDLRIGNLKRSHKCKLSVIQQELVIEVKGEIIKVPFGQIFALDSAIKKVQTDYYINDISHSRTNVIGEVAIGFITDSTSETSNRTNFLGAWTIYEKNVVALMQELLAQAETAPKIAFSEVNPFQPNAPKVAFSEVVPFQPSAPINPLEVSKQVNQLTKTKTCVRCDLRAASLESVDLKGANLEGSNLQGANLSRTDLRRAYLVGATLNEATLVKANLNNVWLTRASMVKANLEGSRISGSLQRANLANVVLRNAKFSGDWSYVDLRNADLSGAVLSGANLRQANLQNANLQGANLSKPRDINLRTNLYDANLRGADLSKANLKDAEFTQADLQGANLMNTNLRNANLIRANLQGANLTNADLRNANLCGATMPDGTASTQGCER